MAVRLRRTSFATSISSPLAAAASTTIASRQLSSPGTMSAAKIPPLSPTLVAKLRECEVPISDLPAACQGCSIEAEHCPTYPGKFSIDLSSTMLGELSDQTKMVLVSTGKTDWVRDVTGESGTLASYLSEAFAHRPTSPSLGTGLFGRLKEKVKGPSPLTSPVQGVYTNPFDREPSPFPLKASILTSSHFSGADDDETDSCIVLPDFKMVYNVARSKAAADKFVLAHMRADSGRAGNVAEASGLFETFPLPYRAVILICSHKTRDAKCHVAAKILGDQLHHALEDRGFEVDERGDCVHEASSAIETWPEERREAKFAEAMHSNTAESRSVAIFKISHIGGHKFAGNVIIAFPNGTSIWYGRVFPQHVQAIVEETIEKGKVLGELLRGGVGISGKAGKANGVLAW